MFTKNKSKSFILLVALLVCAIFVLTACNTPNVFKPVTKPDPAEAQGNGGIAVRYGDWIYYVNGYQSSATASNSYTNDIRTGAIVRIRVADLEKIIKINEADASDTLKKDAIKRVVAGKADTVETESLKSVVSGINGAELVVPNFYYTGNTSSTALNGLYIFNNRIYITTPNNEMDPNGNLLTSQLVLMSYALDGSDAQRHFVFTSNAPQLKLSQSGSDVLATYVLGENLCFFKVGDSEPTTVVEKISSATFSGDYIYFLDENGSICQYQIGQTAHKVLIEKKADDDNTTYAIKSANGEYVYYTVTDKSSQASGLQLFYATANEGSASDHKVALDTIPTGSYFGWGDKVVYTTSVTEESVTMYGIWVAGQNGTDKKVILNPAENDNVITFNKLEGDTLYYTVSNVSYSLDLAKKTADSSTPAVAYAHSLSNTATGWSVPEVLGDYAFSLAAGSVSVVKFDAETKTNSASTAITLTVIEESK